MPTKRRSAAFWNSLFEDEVRFDNEVGDVFFLQAEAQLLRVLKAASFRPAFVVHGHQLLQGCQGRRVEGGQYQGPQL